MIGSYPMSLFVKTNNTVYAGDKTKNRVLMWLEGSSIPTRNISGGLNNPWSLFVTFTDDIYVDNGRPNGRVDKWTSNSTNSIPAMYVNGSCYGLFIDI